MQLLRSKAVLMQYNGSPVGPPLDIQPVRCMQVLRSKAVPMQYDGSPGNSHNPLSEYRCWVHQQDVTGAGMLSRWSRDVDLDICNATRYLNTLHFELPKGARCPYTNGCGRPT
eukprot:364298-Chlamydomonas_euryale.AAC.6